jgi:hypothetical protein
MKHFFPYDRWSCFRTPCCWRFPQPAMFQLVDRACRLLCWQLPERHFRYKTACQQFYFPSDSGSSTHHSFCRRWLCKSLHILRLTNNQTCLSTSASSSSFRSLHLHFPCHPCSGGLSQVESSPAKVRLKYCWIPVFSSSATIRHLFRPWVFYIKADGNTRWFLFNLSYCGCGCMRSN